jgi:hypothetical protein
MAAALALFRLAANHGWATRTDNSRPAHDVLDQPERPPANRIVLEVDVQVFGLHRPIRRYGEFDATPGGPTKRAHSRGTVDGG